jgi:hypothetical protein
MILAQVVEVRSPTADSSLPSASLAEAFILFDMAANVVEESKGWLAMAMAG